MAKKKELLPPKALAQDEMADSTREQQEAHVHAVSRTCQGPLLVDPKVEAANFVKWREFQDAGDVPGVIEFIAKLVAAAQKLAKPGFKVSLPPFPEDGNWYRLRQIGLPLLRLRGARIGQGCGADLNLEIVKHPFDGADHKTECPGCGTEHGWKAPVF